MINKIIRFSRVLAFLGRNRYGKCAGVELWFYPPEQSIWISPLTTKGNVTASCRIEIPIEDIQVFASELLVIAARAKPHTSLKA